MINTDPVSAEQSEDLKISQAVTTFISLGFGSITGSALIGLI